jgi:XTP/dITP diphosphohydrolase
MQHLLLATRNPHKVSEFSDLLGKDFCLTDLSVHPELPEIKETGLTFDENARLKAIGVSRQCPGLVLADDSGLEVDSLGGTPGIFSARYAGDHATDRDNRRKLLSVLAKLPPETARSARFLCVLALAREGELIETFHGTVTGEIVGAEQGADGFGYDSLFQPDGFEKTLAELSAKEKNAISHRGAAVARLREFLTQPA